MRGTLAKAHMLVQQGGLHGVYSWRGEECLPCRYQALREIATVREDGRLSARYGAGLFVATDAHGRLGLIDAQGQVLVPFEFDAIDLFDAQQGPRAKVESSHQLRVGRVHGTANQILYGIWDLAQRRLLLPCSYQHVWRVMISPRDSHGFVVAEIASGRQAREVGEHLMRLLDAQARPMFPQAFAWIGTSCELDEPDAMDEIRAAIHEAWATGHLVEAAETRDGAPIQLRRDGSWSA